MKQKDNVILDGSKVYVVCDWCEKLTLVKSPHITFEVVHIHPPREIAIKRPLKDMVERLVSPKEFIDMLLSLKRKTVPQEEIERMNPEAQIAFDQANIDAQEINNDIELLIRRYTPSPSNH
jgi:hypothetical protein